MDHTVPLFDLASKISIVQFFRRISAFIPGAPFRFVPRPEEKVNGERTLFFEGANTFNVVIFVQQI
jgi:hypothetical protein